MEIINHGVKLGQRPEDYQAGAFSLIDYIERNPSGDWRPYLPTKEIQYGKEDSMSCVSFSAINAIEMQEKFLTGVESNYSDRWIATMSNTTIDGNWLYKVADTIRKYGLVKESSFPAPPNYTFNQYHTKPDSLLQTTLEEEGQSWLSMWDVKYEFITPSKAEMLKHIKQAPLQIVIPGHAIVNFLCEQDIVNYFDTYNPHEKQTPYTNVQSAMKLLLTPKNMYITKKVKINGAYGVLVDMPNNSAITKAEDETEWRSYSKPDSYGIKSVNSDGTTNFDVDLEINF